jgi:hypothetical protein
MLTAIARAMVCTLGALLVATPIGFLVQRGVSFSIVRVSSASPALEALLFTLIVLLLGIVSTALIAMPVEAVMRRWHAGAIAIPTLAAASIASALFWLIVPFPFDPSDAAGILFLQATYFAVYFALRAALRARSVDVDPSDAVASR